MNIAIFGGTGKLGKALAMRLHHSGHHIALGSRDRAKAAEAAAEIGGDVLADTNETAAAWCEWAVISVPYSGHRALLESVKGNLGGKVVIDATVPIDPGNLLQIKTESGKSAAEETAAMLSDADVFAAFHTISHRVVRQIGLSHDVLVAGAPHRKGEVLDFIRSLQLRPIDAGPIEIAGHLERMTTLLLSINKANKVKESGIHITGI
jgi:8-hydroxy-5-deazaflavin:NADPH oxidoreductase